MGRLTTLLYRFIERTWRLLPAKRLWAYLLRPIPIVRKKLYTAMRFRGPFKVRTGNESFRMYYHGHGTIDAGLFWHGWMGQREKVSVKLWLQLAQASSVILDIGANTGIYALSAAGANRSSQIHAFEPSERVFAKLQHNIRLNHFDNITAWPLALSDESGHRTFYDVIGEHQHSASLEEKMVPAEHQRPVTVEIMRLDEFYLREKINRLDLIKIDVEMHEPHVLRGMGELIPRHRPAILIEVLTDAIASEVQALLGPYGYLFYDIDERSSPALTPVIRKSSNLNYLACQTQHAKLLGLYAGAS